MNADLELSQIQQLPVGFESLIQASRAEGFRFLERLREEWDSGENRFSNEGEALFVAHDVRALDAPSLAGIGGVNRDPYVSDPSVGRIRRLYVAPQHRRQGVARALVLRVLTTAPEHFTRVRVNTDTPAADRFYLALGFLRLGADEMATHELILGGSFKTSPAEA